MISEAEAEISDSCGLLSAGCYKHFIMVTEKQTKLAVPLAASTGEPESAG